MKNVVFTKHGPVDHNVAIAPSILNALKTQKGYIALPIKKNHTNRNLSNYRTNPQVLVFGQMELKLLRGL